MGWRLERCWWRRGASTSSSTCTMRCNYSLFERLGHIATDGATWDFGDTRQLSHVAPLASPAFLQVYYFAPRALHFASPSASSIRPSTYTFSPIGYSHADTPPTAVRSALLFGKAPQTHLVQLSVASACLVIDALGATCSAFHLKAATDLLRES